MGFFNKLFSRNRPSKRLKEISQRLAVQSSPNAMTREMVLGLQAGALSTRHQAEEELFDLCENDPATCEIMQRYGATRETLRELFTRLQIAGGAQWAGGHYVVASALAYPHTLEFLLRYFRGIDAIADAYPWPVDFTSDTPERDVALRVAYEIIKYFEDGRTGPV